MRSPLPIIFQLVMIPALIQLDSYYTQSSSLGGHGHFRRERECVCAREREIESCVCLCVCVCEREREKRVGIGEKIRKSRREMEI